MSMMTDNGNVIHSPLQVATPQEVEESAAPRDAASGGGGGLRDSHEVLRLGSIVEIIGLKAKPELNGSIAHVVAAYDPASERYTVELERTRELFRLRKRNIRFTGEVSEATVAQRRGAQMDSAASAGSCGSVLAAAPTATATEQDDDRETVATTTVWLGYIQYFLGDRGAARCYFVMVIIFPLSFAIVYLCVAIFVWGGAAPWS